VPSEGEVYRLHLISIIYMENSYDDMRADPTEDVLTPEILKEKNYTCLVLRSTKRKNTIHLWHHKS